MFTEKSLRDNAHLVKALMGIAAEDFYQMLRQIEQRLPLYGQHRLQRETPQRALGGGRNFGLSLTIRVALVLSYLRLHVPQAVMAVLYVCPPYSLFGVGAVEPRGVC
jgi:hypothetical protein